MPRRNLNLVKMLTTNKTGNPVHVWVKQDNAFKSEDERKREIAKKKKKNKSTENFTNNTLANNQ